MANVDLKTNFKNGDKLYDYELNNNFKAIKAALEAMNKIVWQNDDNASLVMFAGTTEQITNRELIEGQLLYNTQTGETYIDAMVDTELKRISTGGGTSIQIGGIDPTNPATKLWVEDDMLDNIGSEIESGSNENGSYIKFADGTMICESLAQMTLTNDSQSGYFHILFPAEYISAPNIICTNSYHYYPDIIWATGEVTVNGVTLFWQKISGIVGANQTVDCRYVAIGKWK